MRKTFVRVSLFAALLLMIATIASAEQYKFQVHNNTNQAIKKILVSEDGKEWGFFNIGSGIKSGATVTLVWDESTTGESCEQYFKAVFANGEESESEQFDFCESDVALEFGDAE